MPVVFESLEALQKCVGQEYAVSEWIDVSPEMVKAFGEVTGDRQWIHLDEERAARETPFGGSIAHGLLTLSLTTAFMQNAATVQGVSLVLNAGFDRVRFITPVRVGSKLRGRLRLLDFTWSDSAEAATVDPRRRRHATLRTEIVVEMEGAERPACVAEAIIRRYPSSQ